ncbi:MAG TPA: (2Fe-2S)-binding protein [Alphaproteobacteria bacterium]|nr:(2Fe-2S)-binding protein [Alphaproteobacteria bacterium]MDP6271799.1 (2Fe-2S)-binding protein [Alphaproteobacteria bacterium]MDP7165147.1 (2Fe-2S)-binding protein [Alphaproteobacteria bacterium]HJM51211.1 (2Fe-2S)-binding protein [Alphaproteobacteria bacterium]
MVKQTVAFTVNGRPYEVDVPVNWTLLRLLRDELGLIGTKDGCSQGVCGACTVLLDGVTVRACLSLAVRADGRSVTTVEGLKQDGKLHRLQQAFMDQGAVQCGFCTPGMLLSSAELLEENPTPNEDEVREALVGNLCRCTGYTRIVRAVVAAGQGQ